MPSCLPSESSVQAGCRLVRCLPDQDTQGDLTAATAEAEAVLSQVLGSTSATLFLLDVQSKAMASVLVQSCLHTRDIFPLKLSCTAYAVVRQELWKAVCSRSSLSPQPHTLPAQACSNMLLRQSFRPVPARLCRRPSIKPECTATHSTAAALASMRNCDHDKEVCPHRTSKACQSWCSRRQKRDGNAAWAGRSAACWLFLCSCRLRQPHCCSHTSASCWTLSPLYGPHCWYHWSCPSTHMPAPCLPSSCCTTSAHPSTTGGLLPSHHGPHGGCSIGSNRSEMFGASCRLHTCAPAASSQHAALCSTDVNTPHI
jgi:hypothetical protein